MSAMLIAMGAKAKCGSAWIWAAVAMVALALMAVLVLPGTTKGDIDPLGALLGITSLVVAVISMWLSWRALRQADGDTTATAMLLSQRVLAAETRARSRMLDGSTEVIDVQFDLHHTPGHEADVGAVHGQLGDVANYYRSLSAGRLVVTGAPGAGKTLLAIELILALLEQPRPGEPVPVRLALSSWAELASDTNPSGVGTDPVRLFTSWMSRTLVETYRLPPTAARALVDAGMILPVLDGLDEMDAADTSAHTYGSRARHALGILNSYQHGRTRAPLVLTSRSGRYQDLQDMPVWVRDAAHIEITPVAPSQAQTFIRQRADAAARWEPVLNELEGNRSGSLARALSNPWWLTIAVTAYEQRDPSTGVHLNTPSALLNIGLSTEQRLHNHLMQLWLTSTIATHPPPGRTSPAHVRAWLGVLASYLNTNARTARIVAGRSLTGIDLVPHELWPLAGPRRARIAHLLILAAMASLTAIIVSVGLIVTPELPVQQVLGAYAVLGGVFGLAVLRRARTAWPRPSRFDPRLLRTAAGRGTAAAGLTVGLIIGLSAQVTGQLKAGLMFGPAGGLASGLVIGLRTPSGTVTNPRESVRADLMVGAAFGVATGFTFGLWFGSIGALMFGLATGFGQASAGTRYLALLMCTRRSPQKLPWRLGHNLRWAEQAGLLRIAGAAYQFRHREVQDWLANPNHRL
ncbi:NACHT domain-containing protein [Streptomyces sp. NPDC046909]|uniref:NACHT domain-containing protein n=1 Tax=Streptomyces sp. NPDC046909 TaxID=3155617 RepID=UPI00340A10A5